MADTAATPKKEVTDEKLFAGLTEAEKKFLLDLGDFLAKYHNFAGKTPYDVALARTLALSVSFVGERAYQAPCKKWCPGPHGTMWCCET